MLKTATINAAELLRISESRGVIETGKDADFILVKKNPLDSIAFLKNIEGMMLNGRWISKSDLNKIRQIM
ncbi:MAG: amidohydrolase family protein [Calditrichaeota bacterium]|nr:amidohydrolase family protein [Calditrichota bacterium]